MIYPHQQKLKYFDGGDVCKITVSAEKYDEVIDKALDANEIEDIYSNSQEDDADLNRYDNLIQY